MNTTTINHYRDLVAWQKGMDLVEAVYRLTAAYPPDERFGLVVQTRRAAVSVPSNIAEGFGRSGKADFLRFLGISIGSVNEVETQLLIAVRLGFMTNLQMNQTVALSEEVRKILKGLIGALRKSGKSNIGSCH
ncbi:MAG: four helix bundle protein [Planctomycetota bacterium]|nr:four helix bundle protein [Planctomycetota bacterium]